MEYKGKILIVDESKFAHELAKACAKHGYIALVTGQTDAISICTKETFDCIFYAISPVQKVDDVQRIWNISDRQADFLNSLYDRGAEGKHLFYNTEGMMQDGPDTFVWDLEQQLTGKSPEWTR